MRHRTHFHYLIVFMLCVMHVPFVLAQNAKIDSLIRLSKIEKDSNKLYNIVDELAWSYLNVNISKAIEFGEKGLSISKGLGIKKNIAYSYNSLGTFYLNKPNYDRSMFCYQEALKILEELNDDLNISKAHNNIGNIFQKIDLTDKAIEEYKLALEYKKKAGGNHSPLMNYMNLGSIYFKLKNFPESRYYYENALAVVDTIKDRKTLPLLYSNLGVIERHQNNYEGAMQYYKNAERIGKMIGYVNPDLYSNLSALYEHKGDYETANSYLQKAYVLLNEKQQLDKLLHLYLNMSINYTYMNVGDSARKYVTKYVNLRDSLYTVQSLKSIQEVSAKYETEKKEQQISLLAKDKALQDLKLRDQSLQLVAERIEKEKQNQQIQLLNQEKSLKELQIQKEQFRLEKNKKEIELLNSQKQLSEQTINKQRTFSYFIIGGLIMALIFSFFIFNGFKKQKAANKLIVEQKKIVEEQKALVDEKQKEILDSIHYAKRIQTTLLAHSDFINEHLPSNFIFFKPKDIVSGDFYWATKRDHLFYLAVCDSTGHGVPGAFMSLLNINLLNEAINEKNITEPHKVFDHVRERLIGSISREGQKDGFDGILLCFDKKLKKITYSSAHNAPLLIRDKSLIELEKDKMPVGQGENKTDFRLFTLNYQTNDILYLYTDGYADQFGGPKGKKFMYKQLNSVLSEISTEPMDVQRTKLSENFEKWRGNLEQVDDVCVLGIGLSNIF